MSTNQVDSAADTLTVAEADASKNSLAPKGVDPAKNSLTLKDLYEQGSKCCQQYSQLTMQVRTLAQQVMIAYAVGIGLFIARSENLTAEYLQLVMCASGGILFLFGIVLCFLNAHHSNAFRAIRDDCLVPLEKTFMRNEETFLRNEVMGPWQAHQEQRGTKWKSKIVWYVPFLALWIVGGISFWAGIGWWPFK